MELQIEPELRRALQSSVRVWWTVITRSGLASENNGVVWLFLNDWDWLRGSANPCLQGTRPVEVLLHKQRREKCALLSLRVRHPEEDFLDQAAIWDQYSSPKIYIPPWMHCLARFFSSDDDLQSCAVRDFSVVLLKSRGNVGTIPYRTVCMIIDSPTSWIMELRMGIGLQTKCESIMNCDHKKLFCLRNHGLHKPEWHFSIRSIISVPVLGAFIFNL